MREYREKYPYKAVTYFSQQFPQMGWAVLMGGGSLPNIPINTNATTALQKTLLHDVCQMTPMNGQGCVALGNNNLGYLIYTQASSFSIDIESGKYQVYQVNAKTGEIKLSQKKRQINQTLAISDTSPNSIYWISKR